MNPGHFYAAPEAAPPSPWQPMFPANPPPSSAFWGEKNVQDQLRDLQETLALAKAMQRELELLMKMKDSEGSVEHGERESTDPYACGFAKYLEGRRLGLETQESLSVEAASYLMAKFRAQLEPFRFVVDETIPWKEKSAASKLSNKRLKSKRNKLWRKKKRKLVAEMKSKEHEQFEQADREADDWRAREVAKDIAQVKMGKMKEIAKLKAKEERKKLESELELVLIVEKLQELRSVRIQKLKKQGHFLPEEDDKFLERVRAAVEEEERQALAQLSPMLPGMQLQPLKNLGRQFRVVHQSKNSSSKPQMVDGKGNIGSDAVHNDPSDGKGSVGPSSGGAYDSVANLPIEFYHNYHGSNNDMGTLIEVRRMWDAYIRAGGSHIQGTGYSHHLLQMKYGRLTSLGLNDMSIIQPRYHHFVIC